MSDRPPIPVEKLIPVAVACAIITVLTFLEVSDLILIPIVGITLLWLLVLVGRHYWAGPSRGQREQGEGGA